MRDRGGSYLEYAVVFAVVAAVAGSLFASAPNVGDTVATGVDRLICQAFGGQDCPEVPDADASQTAGSDEDSAVVEFVGGGLGSAWDSTQTLACMAGACGSEGFTETWANVGNPQVATGEDEVLPCPDWAAAENASPTRADGTPRQESQVGTFNMYGSVGHDGEEEPIVSAIERSVEDREPVFLGLQEACRNQAEALADRLDGYSVHFVPIEVMRPDEDDPTRGTTSTQPCSNGEDYGTAVLFQDDFADDMYTTGGGTSGGDGEGVDGYSLETPDQREADTNGDGELGEGDEIRRHEKRGMACVSSASQEVVFCSAHLTVGGDSEGERSRAAETEAINDILAEDYPEYTTFVVGDFNATPGAGELDSMYDPRYGGDSSGGLKEADSAGVWTPFGLGSCRGGEPTIGGWSWGPFSGGTKKIDYIFMSPDVEIRDADATQSDDSDHDPYWSDVTF